ncbi:hypothetical protein NBRC116594_14090 [Shimia sp. NS0008-38b]
MTSDWQEEEKDSVSGRIIFARDIPRKRQGTYGTHDFATAREFQVRSKAGDVLFQVSGSAEGEYWCGVFLFFVEGSEGRQVKLDESDVPENKIFDVPETPLHQSQVWT